MSKREPNRIYLRAKSGVWYMSLHDPVLGVKIRKSTKKKTKEEALKVFEAEQEFLNTRNSDMTLRQMIEQYADIERNPRRERKLAEGSRYSIRYSRSVARHAGYLIRILESKAPALLKKRIGMMRTADGVAIRNLLLKTMGPCRTSQYMLRTFKAMFSEAKQSAQIDINYMQGLPDIGYKEKKREAVYPEYINMIIGAKDSFAYIEDWAYLTILATTGMRRSEALALSVDQLFRENLTIDRALIDSNADDMGLPKGGTIRIIPLSKKALEAFHAVKPGKKGRLFYHGGAWVNEVIKRMKATMTALYPEDREIWNRITPHIFRHSLNTNLKALGVDERKVDTYMSWEHQSINEVADRYTHLQARQLKSVASAIDALTEGRYDEDFNIINKSPLSG